MNNKKSDKRAGEKQKKEILFRTNLFIYFFWLVLTQTKQGQQQKTDRRAGKKWNKRPKKISVFFFILIFKFRRTLSLSLSPYCKHFRSTLTG